MSTDSSKAASRSASLRPDQEAKLVKLLKECGVKRSHYYQMLVDLDLSETVDGKIFSRAIESKRSPITLDRMDRMEKTMNQLLDLLSGDPNAGGNPARPK